MNKQRKTSHILNVFQYDADGHVVLPASLTLGIVPGAEDNSGKVPSTAWVRGLVSTTGSSLVPTSRSITINGTSYDLSSNRSWSIDTGVLTASAGSGISVSVVNQNLNIVNTGLLTGTAGAGISVSTVNQNLNIVNTGLLTGTAGAGISVSTVNQNLNIVNTGLLTASSGLGISVSTVGQNLNIVNTGILTASAGSGISVSVVGQNLNIVNSGILTATAGAGISLSVVDGNLNIVNTITNNNQLTNGAGYATTSYVTTQINNLVAGAPGLLDTLDELAAALGDDANFATTTATSLGNRLRVDTAAQGLTSTQQGNARTNLGLGTAALSATGDFATAAQGTKADTAFGWGNHASAGYLTTSSAASTYVSLTGSYANPSWITSLAYSKISGVPAFLTSYTETDTLASVTARGASTSTRTTFVELGVTKAGSDTVAAGPWFRWTNVAEDRQMLAQLNASNGLTYWSYNGSAWATAMTLSQAGALSLTGTILASNFSGSSSGTNTGDQTNISGNAATTSQRDFSGDISTSGMGRFTGWYNGNAATGLAAEIGISAGQAYIIAYNRQTSTYGTLNLEGSASTLRISGSTVNVVSGALQQGGNQVLHAGNVGSYAVTSLTDTLASVTSRGSTTSSTLTSTNTLGLYVNSGGASYIGINSTSNWSYVSHLNNGSTIWDIGAYNGGQYEFRPYGGNNNRVTIQLNGQFSVNNSQNQVALFQSPNGNTWVDIVSNAGTWSMGAASNNRWALYNRGGTEGTRFEVSTSDAWVNGNTVLHAGNYGSYALTSNSDSEQQVGLRYLYWNEGVRRMNTDPRWNESGYDTDLGCLHIWSWTAGGVAYGRAGIALYNGSAYQYLTTQSGQSNIYVNNNPIIHGGNIGSQSVNYASYALYLNAVNNYSWNASFGSTSFHQGISSSFVSASEGFPSYGSVMTMRTYSGGGGTLQLYTPYSYAYGGNRLGFRFSDYVTGTWTGWRYLLNDSTDPYAANMNQDVRTDSGPTFANVYNNGWFRNNAVNVGLYNQAVDTHFYSSSTGEWNFATSNGSWTQINLRPGGHNSAVRGCFYADTGNNVGILNNAGSWGIRLDSARHSYMYGNLTVGLTTNASSIYMSDGDEGAREIHCNSNRIGFLNQSSSWGAWCDDSGNWLTGGGVYAGIFYDYDNGGYYLDPNSTSNLLHIQMPHRGNGTPNLLVNNGGSENWGAIHIEGGSGNLRIGKSDAGRSWSGRVSLAMHVGASESFRVHSDGWDSLFEVWGSSGYARLKGSLEVGSDVYLGTRGTWLSSWLNQNVRTDSSPSFSNIYANDVYTTGGWFRNHTNNNGIYWSSTGWHLYPYDANDFYMRSGSGEASIRFLRSDGAVLGYIHNATDFTMGFLTSSRSWRLRVENGGRLGTYGPIARSSHSSGFLEGSYNNVGGNSYYTNPIYTIGSSYNPSDSSLGGMYGIGYSHPNFWGSGKVQGWGLYVCSNGVIDAVIGGDGASTSIWAKTDIVAYSDARVKEDVKLIENSLEKIKAIRGVSFTRNDVKDKQKRSIGVIAQEVLAVLPEVVSGTEQDMYSVAYGNMVGLLIEGIKEQQKQIEELQNKLDNVLSNR
jgi:predicted heme/steroid binding protein